MKLKVTNSNQFRVSPYIFVVPPSTPPNSSQITQQIDDEEISNDSRRPMAGGYLTPTCACLKPFLIGVSVTSVIILAVTLPFIIILSTNNQTTTRTTTTTTTSTSTSTTTSTSTSSTTTTTKPCLTTCNAEQSCVNGACVGIGYLSCTLIWSRPGDGDIVVTTPNDRTISYRNKLPTNFTDYGQLDVDDTSGTGPENIFWSLSDPAPPVGVYIVCFEPFNIAPSFDIEPLSIQITITRQTSPTIIVTRTLTTTEKNNYTCNATTNTFITSFTYP